MSTVLPAHAADTAAVRRAIASTARPPRPASPERVHPRQHRERHRNPRQIASQRLSHQ